MTNQGGGKEAKITEWESIYQKGLQKQSALYKWPRILGLLTWVFWNATTSGRNNLFSAGVPEVQPMGLFADHKALLYSACWNFFSHSCFWQTQSCSNYSVCVRYARTKLNISVLQEVMSAAKVTHGRAIPQESGLCPRCTTRSRILPQLHLILCLAGRSCGIKLFQEYLCHLEKREFSCLQGQKKKSRLYLIRGHDSGLRNFTSPLNELLGFAPAW